MTAYTSLGSSAASGKATPDSGIAVQCLVARIAAPRTEDLTQFETELVEQRPPSAAAQAFPLRMLIA